MHSQIYYLNISVEHIVLSKADWSSMRPVAKLFWWQAVQVAGMILKFWIVLIYVIDLLVHHDGGDFPSPLMLCANRILMLVFTIYLYAVLMYNMNVKH